MSDNIEELVKRADRLESDRTVWRNTMAEIAEMVRPLRNELRMGARPEGEKRDRGLYDATAINANQNLGAGLYGTFCNPADSWFSYAPLDEDLKRSVRVKQWLAVESQRALTSCTPSYSQFYSQIISYFLDYGAFGNAVFSSELRDDMTGFVDVCRPLSECCWDTDAAGEVDTMFRRWTTTAAKAHAMFKDGVSAKTKTAAENTPDHPVEIMHAVLPSSGALAGETMKTDRPFVSIYAETAEKHRISSSGYWEFPYFVARWEVAAGEKHGRGPGELALADVKSLNVAQRDNLKAGNMAANPPWGAPHEGDISAIRIAPGKITYGAINQQGKLMLAPLLQGGNPPFSLEITNQVRQAVKDAFYFSLMQLVGRTGMTATEILEIREERMRLLAPYGGRLQIVLGAFALRRFNMMKRLGLTRPPPPELAGRSIQVAFTSPFALAQKSAAANSTLRTVAAAEALAKFDPEIADRVDSDRSLAVIQEGFGAPPDILRSDEATMARRQLRRQMQAAASAAEIADTGAGAAQKGAKALATMRGAPQRQAA